MSIFLSSHRLSHLHSSFAASTFSTSLIPLSQVSPCFFRPPPSQAESRGPQQSRGGHDDQDVGRAQEVWRCPPMTTDPIKVGKNWAICHFWYVSSVHLYLIHVGNVGSQVFGTVKQSVRPFDLNSFPDFRRTQVCTISALKEQGRDNRLSVSRLEVLFFFSTRDFAVVNTAMISHEEVDLGWCEVR